MFSFLSFGQCRTSDSVYWDKLQLTSRATTTEVSPHAENDALLLLRLVHSRQLVLKLLLGDIGSSWVDDIKDHLLALQQRVGDELARSQRHGRGRVL